MANVSNVQLNIRDLKWELKGILDNPDECSKWLRSFVETLEYQDLMPEDDRNLFAMSLVEEAKTFSDRQRVNAQKKVVRRTLESDGIRKPTKEQVEAKWREMYGDGTPFIPDKPEPKKAKEPVKECYGEFGNVRLSADEYSAWKSKAKDSAEEIIQELSRYMASTGTSYKSHYATLCSWLSRRQKEGNRMSFRAQDRADAGKNASEVMTPEQRKFYGV